jgi:hypothetical protein
MALFLTSSKQAFNTFLGRDRSTSSTQDDSFPTAIDLDALLRTFDHPVPTVLNPRRVLVVVSYDAVWMIGYAWHVSATARMFANDNVAMVRLGAGTFSANLNQSLLCVSLSIFLPDRRSLVLGGLRGSMACRTETAGWVGALAGGDAPGPPWANQ